MLAVVGGHAAAAARHERIFGAAPIRCSPTGARELLAHDGRVVGMQMNLDVARGEGQQAHGVPDDADDLRGIDA